MGNKASSSGNDISQHGQYNHLVSRSGKHDLPVSINMPAIELKVGNLIRVALTLPRSCGRIANCIVTCIQDDGTIHVTATKEHTDKMRLLHLKDAMKFWHTDLIDAFTKLFSMRYCSGEGYRNLVDNLSTDRADDGTVATLWNVIHIVKGEVIDDSAFTTFTAKHRNAILDFDRKCGDSKAASVFLEYQTIYQRVVVGIGKIRPNKPSVSYLTRDATFKSGQQFPVVTIDPNKPIEHFDNLYVGAAPLWNVKCIDLLVTTSIPPTTISCPTTLSSPTIPTTLPSPTIPTLPSPTIPSLPSPTVPTITLAAAESAVAPTVAISMLLDSSSESVTESKTQV